MVLRVDIWHMGITGFWECGFGIFWLDIWAVGLADGLLSGLGQGLA